MPMRANGESTSWWSLLVDQEPARHRPGSRRSDAKLVACGARKISQSYCGLQKDVLRNMRKKFMLLRNEYPVKAVHVI